MIRYTLYLLTINGLVISTLAAVPNYCDPKLIMNDPYWHLHITRADVEAVRAYPRMWPDILAYIDWNIGTFDFYFLRDPDREDAEKYRNASEALHRLKAEVHALLYSPDRLTSAEVDEITKLTKMTAKEFFPIASDEPTTESENGEAFFDIGGHMTIDYSPLVHDRIALEQRYDTLNQKLEELRKRQKLTKAHKRLLRQAQEQIDRLYSSRVSALKLTNHNQERVNDDSTPANDVT